MRFNYYLATAVSAWLLAALVIVSQLVPPFKNVLAAVFTHHWVAKAIIITAAFIAAGFVDRKVSEKAAWYSMLGSLAAIGLFFVVEYVLS